MSTHRPSMLAKLFRRTPRAARPSLPADTHTRLGLTALEAREVPSVTLYNSGDLSVSGTDGPDTLTVQSMAIPKVTGGANLILRVTENGRVTDVPRASVTGKIYVSGLGGNDTIRVNSSIPAVINGGAGNDTLTGGGGADLLTGGGGNDTYPGAERQDRIVDPTLTANRSMGPAVMAKYQALGGAAGVLGQPAENQQSSGRFDWLHFQGGVVVSTAAGAYRVSGPVLAKYEALGGGFGVMGAPTEDVQSAGGYNWCHFEGGVLVSSSFGTYRVSGPLLAKYEALGGGFGFLGVPTEDMQSAGGYDWCHFRSGNTVGVIVSSAAGAWEVHGENLKKYEALGGGFGWLGVPIKDQYRNADGWVQSDFQRGSIVWRSDVGAHLYLSRNQMIAQIDATRADGVFDANEFNFLHGCAVDPNIYMPESVRNLTQKFIGNDPANATVRIKTPGVYYAATWVGEPVGNLAPYSPVWKVKALEAKWFSGLDRPATTALDGVTTYSYKAVQGDLFGPNGPVFSDIKQGLVGDCYLMASLAAVAAKHPNLIRDMFTDNGDGTFTVRFFRDGGKGADYVTVDRQLPVDINGRLVYQGVGRAATLAAGQTAANNPIWAMLVEKAYAQLNQSGWIGQDNTNSYNGSWMTLPLVGYVYTTGINGGKGADALAHITGYATHTDNQGVGPLAPGYFRDDARNAVSSGHVVVVSTKDSITNAPDIAPSHVYFLIKADAGGFLVYNPWHKDAQGGVPQSYLTNSQFSDNFDTSSWIW